MRDRGADREGEATERHLVGAGRYPIGRAKFLAQHAEKPPLRAAAQPRQRQIGLEPLPAWGDRGGTVGNDDGLRRIRLFIDDALAEAPEGQRRRIGPAGALRQLRARSGRTPTSLSISAAIASRPTGPEVAMIAVSRAITRAFQSATSATDTVA